MTPEKYQRAKAIFATACEKTPEDQVAYVAAECGQDAELRSIVEELLRNDQNPLDLESDRGIRANLDAMLLPTSDADATSAAETREPIPDQIGKYHITRKIGEGGMGVVYEARQDSPRRSVALKLLRVGLAPDESLRRFRREIEVLGRFQHPSIAQIYEAGTATLQSGATLPYFAMELIDGMPLTEYAQTHRLDTRQRLDLIATICETIQYAHHKGVIHRDLKPSNILVIHAQGVASSDTSTSGPRSQSSHAAGALPKVLDFGVARATDPDDRAATLQTDTGRLIGTIAYMSPEQIDGGSGGPDARSDIYALGVILYQLLSHRLPHDVSGKSIAEAIWRIREEDPTDLASIDAAFRGDVSTIVAKALEKDKTRRYQTAADMAADIRRYLRDEPIVARPATTLYQLSKFAKRNKALVAGACVAAFALVLATAVSSWQAYVAVAARDEAKRETAKAKEINRFLQDILSSADPNKTLGEEVTAISLLDTAADRIPAGHFGNQPGVLMELHDTIGASYISLGQYAKGEAQYRAAIRVCEEEYGPDAPLTGRLLDGLGTTLSFQNKYDEAEEYLRRAESIRGRIDANGDHAESAWPCALADVLFYTGRYEEAESSYRKTLALVRKTHSENSAQAAEALNGLGVTLEATSRLEEAIAAHREAAEIYRSVYGDLHMEVATCLGNLGNALQGKGDLAAAEAVHREALAIRRKLLKPNHPLIGTNLGNLALVLMEEGKLEEAEQMNRETLALRRATLPAIHHSIAVTLNNLGMTLLQLKRYDEALATCDEAISISEQAVPEGHLMPIVFRANRAKCLTAMGEYDEAERILLASYDALADTIGTDHRRTKQVAQCLADCYAAQDRAEDKAIWTARADSQSPAS